MNILAYIYVYFVLESNVAMCCCIQYACTYVMGKIKTEFCQIYLFESPCDHYFKRCFNFLELRFISIAVFFWFSLFMTDTWEKRVWCEPSSLSADTVTMMAGYSDLIVIRHPSAHSVQVSLSCSLWPPQWRCGKVFPSSVGGPDLIPGQAVPVTLKIFIF